MALDLYHTSFNHIPFLEDQDCGVHSTRFLSLAEARISLHSAQCGLGQGALGCSQPGAAGSRDQEGTTLGIWAAFRLTA